MVGLGRALLLKPRSFKAHIKFKGPLSGPLNTPNFDHKVARSTGCLSSECWCLIEVEFNHHNISLHCFPHVQSETTLWRLKLLAKDALRAQSKPATTIGSNNNNRKNGRSRNKKNNVDISKIKKETYDARPTPAKKGKMAAS